MRQKLICILIANLFAASAPAVALAQDFQVSGSVGIGGIATDDNDTRDPAKLEEFRDLDDGVLFGFDVHGRGSRYWFDLFGENIGRDDQYVNVRGGTYDLFKYRLYSDSLRHNFLFNGITPYTGAGSNTARATLPALNTATWNPVDINYKRRDDGGYFEFQGVSPWYVRVDANQVTWKGTKPGSSSQGLSPGNGYVDLLFPVDYTTRNATFEGGYNTKTLHFDVSYMVSKFDNGEERVTWTNGYWGNGIDTTYLAPDNDYKRFAGNFSWRQLPGNGTLAARFTMDELSTNVSIASSGLGTTSGGLEQFGPSVPTYDGNVKHDTFTVSYAFAPMRQLDGRVYYNYRKRDDTSTHVTFSSGLENEGYSYKTNNFGADGHWRLDRANRFGFGFDYNDTKREGRFDFDRTKDTRYFVEYKNTSLDVLSARVKYTRLDRDPDFLLGNSGTGISDPDYLNRYVTAFDLAKVKQDQVKVTLDWTAAPNLDFGFEAIYKKNNFEQNVLGRLRDRRNEFYLNASYGEPGGPRFTAFGDWEDVKYDSMHRVANFRAGLGIYEPSAPPDETNYNWFGTVKEENWAAGIAVDWPVSANFSLKASAIYYKTDGMVDLALQEGVPSAVTRPVPLAYYDDTKRTSLTVKGVYDFSKALRLTAGYAYEKYDYSDDQYNGYMNTIPANNNANSYLSGIYAYPQYKANIVYALVQYRF